MSRTSQPNSKFIIIFVITLLVFISPSAMAQSDIIVPKKCGVELGGGHVSSDNKSGELYGVSFSLAGKIDFGLFRVTQQNSSYAATVLSMGIIANKKNNQLNHWLYGSFFEYSVDETHQELYNGYNYISRSQKDNSMALGLFVFNNYGKTSKSIFQPRFSVGVISGRKFMLAVGVGMSLIVGDGYNGAIRINPSCTYVKEGSTYGVSVSLILGRIIGGQDKQSNNWND